MLLQATSKDGKEGGLELIDPPPNSKPGDRVYFEGPEFESTSISIAFERLLLTYPFTSQTRHRCLSSIQRRKSSKPFSLVCRNELAFKTMTHSTHPGFTTLETREAAWVNPVTKSVHRIRTQSGYCLAPTLVGASLS